jgi:DNA-binding beta-propeller fold protein YncE
MREANRTSTRGALALAASFALSGALSLGCAAEEQTQNPLPGAPQVDLEDRAYIVSKGSDELTVIDLHRLEIIGRVRTLGRVNHMAELNGDFSKIIIDSSESDEAVVVDARSLTVDKRLPLGRHPTHLSLSRDGRLFAIMNEDDDAISFVDAERLVEVKRLTGFSTPHFMRFSPDGRYGYVANIGAHHLTRVDLASLAIVDHIALDGFEGPPHATAAPAETGFADAQIDKNGVLYAAHAATGRVLVYDTVAQAKRAEIAVGPRPWIAYAEHPFAELPARQLVPSFGDASVALIAGKAPRVVARLPGDTESYGVNFSSKAPDEAFVMNRIREDIAVVDTERGEVTARIDVGGTTETASTTADGRYIVAAVSSANEVVVIDAATHAIVKTFTNVGVYPWSVTIPRGQNYCH